MRKKSFKLTTWYLSYKKLELSRSIVLIINCGLSLKLNLVGDMSIARNTMYCKLQVWEKAVKNSAVGKKVWATENVN